MPMAILLAAVGTGVLAGPKAFADGGLGNATGVSCTGGGCDLKASRTSPARRSPGAAPVRRSGGGSRGGGGGGGGGSAGPPTVVSDGWEYDLGNGIGILPRFDADKKDKKKAGGLQAPQISVEAVARQAVERLQLPEPVIHTSPDEDSAQVVHVPTWMWVEKSSWGPVTETVSVPGVQVTATARPRLAVWSMGDGSTVSCTGPGTPYSAKYRPDAESPDCGYTYRRSSLAQPDKRFTVSVRVTWDVEWRGGGQSGVVPGLVIGAERQLVVDEVQAVVVR
ncbi:hypothetical protein [Streptomyces sp. NPDC021562]|uniref:hypothetical protein n=1 Tax=Streptomyces sp. NPDC021562 TaxID=3155121 RepID=UPI0033F809E0